MSDDDFYHLALLPNDPTKITLISAVVDAKDPLLHQQLKSWREELDRHFAYAKLRDSPKDEGVFQKVVPPFLQPKSTGPSLADQREQQRLERRKNKQREAAEAPSPAPHRHAKPRPLLGARSVLVRRKKVSPNLRQCV